MTAQSVNTRFQGLTHLPIGYYFLFSLSLSLEMILAHVCKENKRSNQIYCIKEDLESKFVTNDVISST